MRVTGSFVTVIFIVTISNQGTVPYDTPVQNPGAKLN